MVDTLGPREQEIMSFLGEHVFDPVLNSETASAPLKAGIRLTIVRLRQRNADMMVQYFWNAVIGTEKSVSFAAQMRREGFVRFEETLDEFRARFSPPPNPPFRR